MPPECLHVCGSSKEMGPLLPETLQLWAFKYEMPFITQYPTHTTWQILTNLGTAGLAHDPSSLGRR